MGIVLKGGGITDFFLLISVIFDSSAVPKAVLLLGGSSLSYTKETPCKKDDRGDEVHFGQERLEWRER